MLDNGEIRVSIFLPDSVRGYYRGARFDWSGIIERVSTAGHHYYAPVHAEHNPEGHDCVSGPAEEFAMTNPMGFAEAKAGESFVKIGVGLLKKDEDGEYRFNGDYQIIRAGDWEIERGPDRVSFLQDFVGERGWAYRYRKIIRLLPDLPQFVMEHRLQNTGEKDIEIDHYNHNFTVIDDLPYGPDYRVEFPFTTTIPIRINNRAWFRDNAIEIAEPLGEDSLWIPLFEGDGPAHYNAAVVRNKRSGATVEFTGDAPITRMVFWAVERAACPEPFMQLKLAPGQVKEWSTRYRFSA
jgi:hypothetical protein